jgi:hypothetical protein
LRTRRYVNAQWLGALSPLLRYSYSRDAYVLRFVGRTFGPVLREDRRLGHDRPIAVERRQTPTHTRTA